MATGKVLKSYTIFITNIKWITGPRELKNYFSNFGDVIKVHLAFDTDTGLHKGYGFIGFKNFDTLQSVLEKQEHILDGRKLTIKQRD